MKNRGDTIPNLGGISSTFHDRPKSNNCVDSFYQYALHVPKLSVIFNNFKKIFHSQFNASNHYYLLPICTVCTRIDSII